MKLTKKQRSTLESIAAPNTIEVGMGVNWWIKMQGKNRILMHFLDGRTCNALASRGLIVNVTGAQGDVGRYVASEEAKTLLDTEN